MNDNATDRQILLMDDEPHVQSWLPEYLDARGYTVHLAHNLAEAVSALDSRQFHLIILDLNVPATDEFREVISSKGGVYLELRGLFAAEYARTKGYPGRKIFVYSVHDSEEAAIVCKRIGVRYSIKSRPREFKRELSSALMNT